METGDLVEFGDMKKRVERVERIISPAWVEMPAQKHHGQRVLTSGGGPGRTGSGWGNFGKQQKVEDKRNPDVDSRLRVMEKFREFVCETNMDSITRQKGEDGSEVFIKSHFKGNCNRDFSQ